ncbi:conserved hypothetical protein [uncultured Sporomusa sp.]|uniref:DUF5652 domain-containing protein n=1 Tax=uncultured Sporomusa sp. TaxID=307249 RepID=A0A212M1Q6_9FIRM|nr:DUF5652 family protein [uncultured Sporomusa sp.]SCM83754.1 conserved hypothetical protein [uncultured Sporomusa sp.]
MDSILSTFQYNPWLLAVITVWSITWKAIATWHAARNSQLGWFIALFIINTIGVLEIIYLVFFSKRKR